MREARAPDAEVLVATTWSCNLRCGYCFVEQNALAGGGARMAPETAARLIDALDEGLPHVGSICVHLYGGEPLTNLPAAHAALAAARAKPAGRFSFAVTTNGTVASDAAMELLDEGRFDVVLSIDGPARVHDAWRRFADGRPSHARVLRFLAALRSRTRCRVRASAVVRPGWSLAEASAYLRTLPVDAIKAQAVRLPDGAPGALDERERAAYLADLERIGDEVVRELEAGEQPRDDRFASRVLQLLAGRERARFCGAGDTAFGIAPDGTVLPCILLDAEEHALGSLSDAPRTWVAAGARWRARSGPRAECADCAALPLCGGGCPAVLPVCGAGECDIVRRNCAVAERIHARFADEPEALLSLAGIP